MNSVVCNFGSCCLFLSTCAVQKSVSHIKSQGKFALVGGKVREFDFGRLVGTL